MSGNNVGYMARVRKRVSTASTMARDGVGLVPAFVNLSTTSTTLPMKVQELPDANKGSVKMDLIWLRGRGVLRGDVEGASQPLQTLDRLRA